MTRITCQICLAKTDGILLLPLAWDRSFSTLTIAEQNQLERNILATLRDEGFDKVELYDQLDYELLSEGIKDLNDPVQRAKVNSALGYPYFLAISLDQTRDSEGWNYRTAEELYTMTPPVVDMDISASMRVALIETETGEIVSDNAVQSEITNWGFPDEDGGKNYWNFGTVQLAIQTATRKGIKFIADDCAC